MVITSLVGSRCCHERRIAQYGLLAFWLPAQTAFDFAATNANATATEPYGLNAMAQFDGLPYLKLDTMAAGRSSYDRSGGNVDTGNFPYIDGTNI